MALNDFYTTYKCKICGSPVKEIPLCDTWGEHVMSKYKCTNRECNMKVSECDNVDINKFVETTYHDVRREEEERLKKFYVESVESNREFSLQEVMTHTYFRKAKYFYTCKSKFYNCEKIRISEQGELQLFVEENFIDIDGEKVKYGWINCNITHYWLNAKFKLTL